MQNFTSKENHTVILYYFQLAYSSFSNIYMKKQKMKNCGATYTYVDVRALEK